MVAAVVAAIALTLLRPAEVRVAPPWVLPLIEAVLLVALIANDPGRIDRRSAVLRGLSICVVGILVVDALLATATPDFSAHPGRPATNSAGELLRAGTCVWASNVIAFALLYWELDAGGAAARATGCHAALDLAFPQQLNPEVAPAGWRPRFVDYLYLGLTAHRRSASRGENVAGQRPRLVETSRWHPRLRPNLGVGREPILKVQAR